jgi:hypothetical protein
MSEMQFIIDRLEAIDSKFDEKLDKILIQTTTGLENWKRGIAKSIW